MSLFIGKDNNGKDIMHITENSYSAEDMKNNIKSDTIFHNDLPFYTYDIYPVSAVMSDSRGYYCVYATKYVGDPYGDSMKMGGGEGVIASRYADEVYWLDANKNIIQNPEFFWFDRYQSAAYRVNWSYSSKVRTSTHYIPYMYIPSSTCERYDSSFPIMYALVLTNKKLIPTYGAQIKGTNGGTPASFIVGGFDLANIRYVSNKIINAHPSCTVLSGVKQLIDASAISGGIEIISNPYTGTVIKKGGYPIIQGSPYNLLTLTGTYYITGRIPSDTTYTPYSCKPGDIHKITFIDNTWREPISFLVIEGSEISVIKYKIRVTDNEGWFSYYAEGTLYYGVTGGKAYTRGIANDGEVSTYSLKVEVFSY